MLSNKRKFGEHGLGRRVRARKDEESDVEAESSDAPSEEEVDGSEGDGSEEEYDDEDISEQDEDVETEDEHGGKNPTLDLSSISFGDLAKAHAAISKQSKKSASSANAAKEPAREKPAPSKPAHTDTPKPPKRSNKHAPTEMSSKRPVSRKRDIVTDTKPKPRDPRFDPLSGPLDEAKFKKAYAFLDSYRDDEINKLREAVKKTKNADAKEDLKRQLKSLEGKRDAERKKAEEQRVLEEHKKREKELVKQGKRPFYLKRAEQKKRLLAERYKTMNKKQVEKAIVRKRKKEATKDRIALEEVEKATGARARR